MRIITNRYRLITYATLFNLLFEYSARGIKEFIQRPLLVLALFGIYFTYFAMLEDLIVRFKLINYQLFLIAFFYGLFPIAFYTGNLFNHSIYGGFILAGVNLGTVLIIGILAWGVIQGMITLYFANRLSPRDWDHPRMGKIGWALSILYQIIVIVMAHSNPRTPRGNTEGYLVFGVLTISAVALFYRSLKTPPPSIQSFTPSKVMDVLAVGSVILFTILGTFFIAGPVVVTSQPMNRIAVTIENIWVFICGFVFFIYPLANRAEVVV